MVTRLARNLFPLILTTCIWTCGVRAAVIASFQDDFQPGTPAAGWSYLWNNSGPVGNPANYTPLLATAGGVYSSDGTDNLPAAPPGSSVNIGLAGGLPGGHPGLGPGQGASGGIERYAIAAYVLAAPERVGVLNGSVRNSNPNQGGSNDGLNLKVFVNNDPTPKLSTGTAAGFDKTAQFAVGLGMLDAGDTIYVAVGSNGNDLFDSFQLRYDIVSVPEPSVINLVAMAGWGMLICRMPTRARARPERRSCRAVSTTVPRVTSAPAAR